MHDVHHLLAGYDTSLLGESKLAAWELASGGLGYDVFFRIDRLMLLPTAILLVPRHMIPVMHHG